jgi:hypothetical protein
MQMLPFSDLFSSSPVQARFRGTSGLDWGISELVRELAGLAGLLGWLGVLFYLIALFATGVS